MDGKKNARGIPSHGRSTHEGGSYRGDRAETMPRIIRPQAVPTAADRLERGCNPGLKGIRELFTLRLDLMRERDRIFT